MNINIAPIWISSSLLFVIGALLIVTCALVLLLIESKKARSQVGVTLDASVNRQKVLLQEHRTEIEEIKKQYLVKMDAVAKDHQYEMENLRVILSITDQDRDEALKAVSKATQHGVHMQSQIDQIYALMSSWAAGNDQTATTVRYALKSEHTTTVN